MPISVVDLYWSARANLIWYPSIIKPLHIHLICSHTIICCYDILISKELICKWQSHPFCPYDFSTMNMSIWRVDAWSVHMTWFWICQYDGVTLDPSIWSVDSESVHMTWSWICQYDGLTFDPSIWLVDPVTYVWRMLYPQTHPQSEPFLYTIEGGKEKGLTGNDRYEGYAVDLAKMIMDRAKVSHYEIIPVKDENYGSCDDNGTWNGMVGELIRGVSAYWWRESLVMGTKAPGLLGVPNCHGMLWIRNGPVCYGYIVVRCCYGYVMARSWYWYVMTRRYYGYEMARSCYWYVMARSCYGYVMARICYGYVMACRCYGYIMARRWTLVFIHAASSVETSQCVLIATCVAVNRMWCSYVACQIYCVHYSKYVPLWSLFVVCYVHCI